MTERLDDAWLEVVRRGGTAEAAAFARLALELDAARGTTGTAELTCAYARAVAGCAGAGVVVRGSGGSLVPLAATDDATRAADRAQAELGVGPAHTALSDAVVVAADLADDDAWGAWTPAARALGLRSAAFLPLAVRSGGVGVLSLYSTGAAIGDRDLERARVLAQHAALALARSRLEEQLLQALDSRGVIARAQGVLMERHGIDAEAAFDLLRRSSQALNLKLTEVAARTLASGRPPGR